MIKVIIFDLGNVIISVDHFLFCKRLAEVSTYSATDIYEANFKTRLVQDYEKGRISSQEFYNEICYQLRTEIDFEEFSRMWNEIFYENEAISDLIRALKANYRLLLLSNTNELHFEFARQEFPVLNEFEQYLLSYQLRAAKPNPRIFQKAIRTAKCEPHEIIYIDDIAEYAQVAQSLGINGIHFRDAEQLKQELKKHQVFWPNIEKKEPELPDFFL